MERINEKVKINLNLKHLKKLHKIYDSKVPLIQPKNNIINLSSVELDTKMSKIMELGLNCHLKKKYNHNSKLIEIEKL